MSAIITFQSPAKSPAMDPVIWSRLPEEILEHILALLPLKSFLNLRSTCKHFRSLVFSPNFVSKHSSSSPFSSFLLLSHPQCHGRFPIYDSALNCWRHFALSFSPLVPPSAPFTLVCSSNGLFCFSLPNSSSFLVCNLLAKSSRVIQFPSHPFQFEMLTLISTQFGYKLFTICSKFNSNFAFVYDSSVHSWTQFDGFHPILTDNLHQEGVYLNGSMYFTTPEPYSIVNFNLETGIWERLNVELPAELTFVRLVSDNSGGKLFLLGGIGRNGISRSMNLWEIGDGGDLVEVDRLPELMCRKFMSVCYHNYEHVYCFWHQGMICVCCYTWPEILYYKVSRRTWHWLPRCPSLPEKWSCGFRWFSFVPELFALV